MKLYDLNFWQTGEYQVIEERLDDYKKASTVICPQRRDIFRSLKETPYGTVKCIVVGQDPYPNPKHATGIAFDIPAELQRSDWPPTLINVLKEYQDDLHYPDPSTGSLLPWCRQGVLLWNSIPTTVAYSSLAHSSWTEYTYLNKELIGKLCDKGDVVFVFLGSIAKENMKYLTGDQKVLTFSHPSPRARHASKTPFFGSRMFSTINDRLKEPIDWRLP